MPSQRGGHMIRDPFAMHFVTFTTVGWVDVFSRKECKAILLEALRYCVTDKGLKVHAYVIMESHIHLVVSAREDSSGLSAIIRDFKRHSSKAILHWTQTSKRESRRDWMLMVFQYHAKYNKRNERYQVWQQHNQPKRLVYPRFTAQKVQYIHNNPVVARIVDEPEAYLHSSARNYAGRSDFLLEVDVIEFGAQEGFVMV